MHGSGGGSAHTWSAGRRASLERLRLDQVDLFGVVDFPCLSRKIPL